MPRVAASEREEFIEGRRAAILEAALGLWSKAGFDATSVSAIAEAAGMTKGTLYLYFPSKRALLEAVIARFSLRPDVESLVERFRDQPLEEVVRILVEATWERLTERKELVGVLLRELPNHLDQSQIFLEQALLPTNRLFASFLEEKLGPERMREIHSIVAGRSLFAMVLMFFVSQEILGGARLLPVDRKDIVGTISEVFLHGVRGQTESPAAKGAR